MYCAFSARKILSYFNLRGRGRNWKIFLFICVVFIFLHLLSWINSRDRTSQHLGAGEISGPKYYCEPQKNIVYIKEIKCASTTLTNMLRRYGLQHNLSFVLPRQKRIYLGWPYLMEDGFYRPSKTGEFNILCEHAVYNKDIMASIMPENTVYVTSLREPYSQFKSMFNYYNMAKILGLQGDNPISEFLRTLPKYEILYKSHNASKIRYCVPDGFSMSRNLMSYNLGFQTGFPYGAPDFSNAGDEIMNFILGIDNDFHLVMIVEFFDESLILLKRLLCWGFRDIVYQSENVGSYKYRQDKVPDHVAIYKNWSRVDYSLYNHFREELIKRIEDQRDDFAGEVAHFKQVNYKVSQFCSKISEGPGEADLVIEGSRWSDGFRVDRELCQLLVNEDILQILKHKYDQIPVLWEDQVPDQYFC